MIETRTRSRFSFSFSLSKKYTSRFSFSFSFSTFFTSRYSFSVWKNILGSQNGKSRKNAFEKSRILNLFGINQSQAFPFPFCGNPVRFSVFCCFFFQKMENFETIVLYEKNILKNFFFLLFVEVVVVTIRTIVDYNQTIRTTIRL